MHTSRLKMVEIVLENPEQVEQEFRKLLRKKLAAVGFVLEGAVIDQIDNMGLVNTGHFRSSVHSYVEDGTRPAVVVESAAKYATYLEYGTFSYFDIFGSDKFPKTPHPKKKNMGAQQRRNFPKGMQPFAPFRRGILTAIPKIAQVLGGKNT